ncbi:MAG: branched-chain amino acid aminotransferase [Saprospiraceae bacterium]|nr:branched-chain amino acid aminotransferase [Saprospiraceae bacterium]
MEIAIDHIAVSRLASVDLTNIPFGRVFTDHMFSMDYRDGKWHDATIEPVSELSLHPANCTLHYGQSIFEGMKAFKNLEGTPILFRPKMHARRLNASAERMCMPAVDEELFIDAVKQLVLLEEAWIPEGEGSALYIRPFMFATDEFLGVAPSETFKFIILTLPVAPYYSQPVKLLASDKYIRAAIGGVGEAKTSGNYAASLYASKKAMEEGYDQILWLDGKEFKYAQEVGTMNIFFVIGDTVVTPKTDGAILKGITRDSFLQLLKRDQIPCEERAISIDEVFAAYEKGELNAVFGSGTAAVAVDVSHIKYKDRVIKLPVEDNNLAQQLKSQLNGIRKGEIPDHFDWTHPVFAGVDVS